MYRQGRPEAALSVTTRSGRRLAPGRDYRVDSEWGVIGLVPDAPREPVRQFARENGVGLADAALRWGHLWREGIPHETLLRNAINHPNTFGISFFADALMDFLGL